MFCRLASVIYRLALLAVLLSGCLSSWEIDPPEPLHFGRYEVGDLDVDWYFHSLISSTTTPVVVLKDSSGTIADTVAVSNGIYEIETRADSLILHSCYPVDLIHSIPIKVGVTVGEEERCTGKIAGGREWSR